MRTQHFLFLLLIIVVDSYGFTQNEQQIGTAVYIEIGGKGFVSGNVDLPMGMSDRMTIGLTVLDHEFDKTEDQSDYPTSTLPTPSLMYFHLFGKDRHYFEAGFGVSVSPVPWKKYSPNDSPISLHGCLGYRYQVPEHFFFRAGFTPFYRVNWMFLPLIGVSAGYSW